MGGPPRDARSSSLDGAQTTDPLSEAPGRTPTPPAPLDVIRQKLESRDDRVRLVALLHAAAHGEVGRPLAAKVASMFADPSPAVQFHAVQTFRRVGLGAADAVPVLLGLRARGTPPMLVSRATVSLGWLGRDALAAVSALKEAFRESPNDREILEALVAIAPNDEDVVQAVVQGVFSSDYGMTRVACDILGRNDGPMVDRVFAEILKRASGGDPGQRKATAAALISLAPRRPALAAEALRGLLREPSAPEAWPAVSAVAELPPPRPADLVSAVIRVAAADVPARVQALRAIEAMGAEASRAEETLLTILAENRTAIPTPGEGEEAARSIAAAAKAFAASCPSARALGPLLEWMQHVATAAKPERGVSWYPVGDVAEVVASLAPGAPAVGEAILALVPAARACLAEDASGVLDFEQAALRGLSRLHGANEWRSRAEQLGVSRRAPYEEPDDDDAPEPLALPDFPSDEATEEAAGVDPLDEGQEALRGAIAAGCRVLEIDASASPAGIAAAVDQWIRRVQRERTGAVDDVLPSIGAAYGHAVRAATAWDWKRFRWRDSEFLAVVSPDEAHLHLPVDFIARQLSPNAEVTAMLLFNMIASGSLPPAAPGTLSVIA